jgi:hypothetical protein
MLTVLITYLTGNTDIRDCLDLSDICLDGVLTMRVIRDESKTTRVA